MLNEHLLNNRYSIQDKIGEGGMGKTFLATDTDSDSEVIVKILNFRGMEKWKTLELFEREAKTLKNLDFPFIPKYVDYFIEDNGSERHYYIVQQYMRGENLFEKVKAGKHYNQDDILTIAKKMLHILMYLHELNPPVIHRDITPRNIIESSRKEIYLVEFGAVQDKVITTMQGASTIVGTFGYMPMEQIMARTEAKSDLYALGMTLLFLLAHKEPSEFPLQDISVDYKPYVRCSDEFMSFIDALIEPTLQKRINSAAEALEFLNTIQANVESSFHDSFSASVNDHPITEQANIEHDNDQEPETVVVFERYDDVIAVRECDETVLYNALPDIHHPQLPPLSLLKAEVLKDDSILISLASNFIPAYFFLGLALLSLIFSIFQYLLDDLKNTLRLLFLSLISLVVARRKGISYEITFEPETISIEKIYPLNAGSGISTTRIKLANIIELIKPEQEGDDFLIKTEMKSFRIGKNLNSIDREWLYQFTKKYIDHHQS